jgi:membrane-associated phospholipid phosphatase
METTPKLAPVWFGLALAIGWSRIETSEHYPYQVILGGLLGCALGYAMTHLAGGLLFPRLTTLGARRKVESGASDGGETPP